MEPTLTYFLTNKWSLFTKHISTYAYIKSFSMFYVYCRLLNHPFPYLEKIIFTTTLSFAWKRSVTITSHITSFSFTLSIHLCCTALRWVFPRGFVDKQLFEKTQFFMIHILKDILKDHTQYCFLVALPAHGNTFIHWDSVAVLNLTLSVSVCSQMFL